MKRNLVIIFFNINFFGYGQNLIVNGDFETYSECPSSLGELSQAIPWINLANVSPDYYNKCAEGFQAGTPSNSFGHQIPSSGDGYAGIYTYENILSSDVREYVSIELNEPLEANTMYILSFEVSRAEESNYAVSTIGAYLSKSASIEISQYLIEETPQIEYSGEAITDTLNWVTVSGSFNAEGGEKYLTIGNFKNDENCGLLELPVSSSFDFSYYYIDDVILTKILSSTEDVNSTDLKVFPNPFSNTLMLKTDNNLKNEIILFDSKSSIIFQKFFYSSLLLNTMELPKGLYFYEVRNKNGLQSRGKLIKDK